jgi:NAD-dependent SIR2 family protein deacetylase
VFMAHKGLFQIDCKGCSNPVQFSTADLESVVSCTECGKKYGFSDEKLKRQLVKFADLCSQIKESEEILGTAGVAVSVGNEEVKIPFKLLLCRLKSTLDLQIGTERCLVTFRSYPTAA